MNFGENSAVGPKFPPEGCAIALFRYGYVIDGQGRADRALEFGDGFVEIGLGLDLAAASRR